MDTFQIFGLEHAYTILVCIFIAVPVLIFPHISKKVDRDKFGKIMGYTIIFSKLLEYFYRYFIINQPLKYLLPLHVCNFTLFLVGIMLIKKSYSIFRFSYFWSIGAITAVVTPDVTEKFPSLMNISFFFTHSLVIVGVVYSVVYYRFRPTFKDSIYSFIYLNVIMLAIFPINFILDTNFMFLRERPLGDMLWFLGSWPIYIFWFDVITLVLFFLFYLPFFKIKRGG